MASAGGSSNITVAVRVRPFLARELENGETLCVRIAENTLNLYDKRGDSQNRTEDKNFTFDYCHWSFDSSDPIFASQENVYHDVGSRVVEHAFGGFNSTIFAYGQTGSGKSHTMMGVPGDQRGLIPRILENLFASINPDADYRVNIDCSYLEVYQEHIRDLLNPQQTKRLRVRENPLVGVYVENLTKFPVSSFSEVAELMQDGNTYRTIAATRMNRTSSRSHAAFIIRFNLTRKVDATFITSTSAINLVDLAGSERQKKTQSSGVRLREACFINKSLSALGNVISALSKMSDEASRERATFVPYRDSVLTRLLQNSLGGNSNTVMVANISPAVSDYDETLSTLRFAERAKKIKNHAVRNESASDKLIRELKTQVEELERQLKSSRASERLSIEQKALKSELVAARNLIKDLSLSRDDLEKRAEERRRALRNAFSTMGLSFSQLHALATGSADPLPPSLVNLSPDSVLSGNLIYFLRIPPKGFSEVETNIGSGEGSTILLAGLGIEAIHAVVTLRPDMAYHETDEVTEPSMSDTESFVPVSLSDIDVFEYSATIAPFKPNCRVILNGKKIERETILSPGDRLVLGHSMFLCYCVGEFPKVTAQEFRHDNLLHSQYSSSLLPSQIDGRMALAAGGEGFGVQTPEFHSPGSVQMSPMTTRRESLRSLFRQESSLMHLPFTDPLNQLKAIAEANALASEANEICTALGHAINFSVRLSTEDDRLPSLRAGDPEICAAFLDDNVTQRWTPEILADKIEHMKKIYMNSRFDARTSDILLEAHSEDSGVDAEAFKPIPNDVLIGVVDIDIASLVRDLRKDAGHNHVEAALALPMRRPVLEEVRFGMARADEAESTADDRSQRVSSVLSPGPRQKRTKHHGKFKGEVVATMSPDGIVHLRVLVGRLTQLPLDPLKNCFVTVLFLDREPTVTERVDGSEPVFDFFFETGFAPPELEEHEHDMRLLVFGSTDFVADKDFAPRAGDVASRDLRDLQMAKAQLEAENARLRQELEAQQDGAEQQGGGPCAGGCAVM